MPARKHKKKSPKKKRFLARKRKKSLIHKWRLRIILGLVIYLTLYGAIRWQAIKASPLEPLPNFLDSKNNIVLLDSNFKHQFFYYSFYPLLKLEEDLGTLAIYYID